MKPTPCSTVTALPWSGRGIAAAVSLACLAWLLFASQLEADPHGAGTHQQLGLASQCTFHAEWGFACPTCGMTTAFTLASQGRLLAAAAIQPAGALLALLVAMAAWAAGYVAVTGCQVAPLARFLRTHWPRLAVAALFVLLLGWLTHLIAG